MAISVNAKVGAETSDSDLLKQADELLSAIYSRGASSDDYGSEAAGRQAAVVTELSRRLKASLEREAAVRGVLAQADREDWEHLYPADIEEALDGEGN